MKKILPLAVATATLVLFGAGCGAATTSNTATTAANQSSVQSSSVEQSPAMTTTSPISASTVAEHNSSTDCWVIINNKVYDVTSIIPGHPGGPDKIIAQCGGDATAAFSDRQGMGPHPARAQETIDQYYKGDLVQ